VKSVAEVKFEVCYPALHCGGRNPIWAGQMAVGIGRRKFIAALGSAALDWPLAARAQQTAMPVVGFLNSASPEPYAPMVATFRQGLSEAGYVEGNNVAIEYRWANGQYDRLPALAADLVRHQVAVTVATGGESSALVAKAATTTIPIVMAVAGDPIKGGLVASLNHPGSNVTGVTVLGVELASKRLELLHELVPSATNIAVLINPTSPTAETLSTDLRAAARSLGLQIYILQAKTETDLDSAFATLVQTHAGALVIGSDPFFNSQSGRLAALGLRYAVPEIYQYREFAAAGGLISYGGSITDSYRTVGIYTGRVLKGENPADLPIQQSTKVELFINLKTAKAINITVPLPLLGRADEVIE
jgi:putative ABC transport system substrate-binding protein